jgi:hypothetical protein
MYIPEINFDEELQDLKFRGMNFSEDSKTSIKHYLFKGWKPGGHLEAMFAYDYERALYNADIHNRTVFWSTAMWIREFAPPASQGSYEAIEAYCKNKEAQEAFRLECEKKYMWKKLENA